MRVDQAGHDDHAGGVDHLGVFNHQVRAHGGDPVRRDEDVGAGVIANLWVKAQDQAAFEKSAVRCFATGHDGSPLLGGSCTLTEHVLSAFLSVLE